jgi:hypothetical protein
LILRASLLQQSVGYTSVVPMDSGQPRCRNGGGSMQADLPPPPWCVPILISLWPQVPGEQFGRLPSVQWQASCSTFTPAEQQKG